jgi:hypothetical protein
MKEVSVLAYQRTLRLTTETVEAKLRSPNLTEENETKATADEGGERSGVSLNATEREDEGGERSGVPATASVDKQHGMVTETVEHGIGTDHKNLPTESEDEGPGANGEDDSSSGDDQIDCKETKESILERYHQSETG